MDKALKRAMQDHLGRRRKTIQNELSFDAVVADKSGAYERIATKMRIVQKAGIYMHLYINTLDGSSLVQVMP